MLQDGKTVDEPDAKERAELERLQRDGLVEVQWSRFFLCVDHRDDADLPYARDRTCREKIPLLDDAHPDDRHQAEDDLHYECGGCGRLHWPLRRRRTTYVRGTVELSVQRAAGWLREQLGQLSLGVYALLDGAVFRFQYRGREVHVCLLDPCVGTRFATREFAVANPVVHVVIAHRRFRQRFPDADWLSVLFLHELAERGVAALREKLDVLPGDGAVLTFREPAAPVWNTLRSPEQRVVRRQLGAHALQLLDDRAVLDDVEVLPPEATGLLPILAFFVERWREDLLAGKSADDYCAYSPDEVLDDLEERGVATVTSAGSVRRQIGRLRNTVKRNYSAGAGLPLGQDDLVENVAEGGYRLNPRKVTVLPR